MSNEVAPEGRVFVCLACGKRSRDLYGYKQIGNGWDESCMLNAALVDEARCIIENGRVVELRMSEESNERQA